MATVQRNVQINASPQETMALFSHASPLAGSGIRG